MFMREGSSPIFHEKGTPPPPPPGVIRQDIGLQVANIYSGLGCYDLVAAVGYTITM